jgi:hypothetical protein
MYQISLLAKLQYRGQDYVDGYWRRDVLRKAKVQFLSSHL